MNYGIIKFDWKEIQNIPYAFGWFSWLGMVCQAKDI